MFFSSLDTLVVVAHEFINKILTEKLSLKNKKYMIIGHSMGGIVALKYIDRYNHEVEGFIMVEGDVDPTDITYCEPVIRYGEKEFCGGNGWDEFRRKILTSKNLGWYRYVETISLDGDFFANSLEVRTKIFFKNMMAISKVKEQDDLVGMFTKIIQNTPVFYICGDENTNLRTYQLLCQICDGTIPTTKSSIHVTTISGCGHFPFIDNPSEFFTKVEQWLNKFLL